MNCNTPPGWPSRGGRSMFDHGGLRSGHRWTQEPITDAQFLIGIDFGTTCSGVTIGTGASGLDSRDFTYETISLLVGASEPDTWTFEPKVSDLVEAYLKGVWDHCVQHIISNMQGKMSSEQVRQSKFYVTIGAPANWRPGTLVFLLSAARAAGIPGPNGGSKLETCVEPEAAAIALLLEDEKIEKLDLKDAVTFKIQQSTAPMVLERYVASDARFCGPVEVEQLLLDRFTVKIKAVADKNKVATLTADEIQPLFHQLWRPSKTQVSSPSHTGGDNTFL